MDRADIIRAFQRDLFTIPVVRAHADQMAAHMRDVHGSMAGDILRDAARMIELCAAENDDGIFTGMVAAAMLLRAAAGD